MEHLEDLLDDKSNWFSKDFLQENKVVLIFLGLGVALLIAGLVMFRTSAGTSEVQIVSTNESASSIIVEVSGAVKSPGVFTLNHGVRVSEALDAAGGISDNADSEWIARYLNKARVVEDGEKLYIPPVDQQKGVLSASDIAGDQTVSAGNYAENENIVNINTATIEELESLWGIGRITAQNMIDQRPYSKTEELLDRKILKENVYERNKDLLTVY